MCGIAGFITTTKNNNHLTDPLLTLKKMGDQIINRGPDDHGEFYCEKSGVGLSHRRLSIHDLSPLGHQPMSSSTERYIIVFNGEIYNFNTLKRELNSYHFNGRSDTEVLLASIEEWGVENALKKFEGMFAFALWDKKDQALYLARDRCGEKPLYYSLANQNLIFGSQLSAIKCFPTWKGEIDKSSINLLLRYKYIPAPYSIYQGVKKLEAGSFIRVDIRNNSLEAEYKKYWQFENVARDGLLNRTELSLTDSIEHLDTLLNTSIKDQMISDVPLGAFLSGGIDSSTVVGIMQRNSQQPVKSFSIGFDVPGYNEAIFAKEVAQHIGTDHTELYVTEKDAWTLAPSIYKSYDEPFADSSQIPTSIVSQLAKESVTVSLSGDAGDELFSGYSRYPFANDLWNKVQSYPSWLTKAVSGMVSAVPYEFSYKYLGEKFNQRGNIDKLYSAANYFKYANFPRFYKDIISDWKSPATLTNSVEYEGAFTPFNEKLLNSGLSNVEQAMLLDSLTYLQDDILAKVDRAAMGVSLETRVPLLNSKVIEFAWQLPLEYKYRDGEQKYILKKVLEKYVPRSMFERPKKGFGVPLASWLRGPLKDWANSLLSSEEIQREGFFNSDIISRMWNEHQHSIMDHSAKLWSVLMFISWYENTEHGYCR